MRRLMAAAALVGVLAFFASTGTALAAGHSDTGALCKNGHWQTLIRADSTVFKNQGDCVSYAARGGTPYPTCWVSSDGRPDLQYYGPLGMVDNAEAFNSTDGTCSGGVWDPPQVPFTVVLAPDWNSAYSQCRALGIGRGLNVERIASYWTGAPPDFYLCVQIYSG